MRPIITLSLAFCLFSAQAQRLTITDLLSLIHCQDTACVSSLARPMSMCLAGGKEKDGWMWIPCDQNLEDFSMDDMPQTILGFFGYPNSNYYQYFIGTKDTTYATILTQELELLGFKPEKAHSERFVYRSNEYPGLEMERLEKRSASLEPKRKDDPKSRFNKPLEKLPEELAKSLREQGFDSYDEIPNLLWLFRATVRK